MKYRFCCKCKDRHLTETYTGCLGYNTAKLKLNDDGIVDYTCMHCGMRDKGNHNKFEPIEIKTTYRCEHVEGQLAKGERIELNISKGKENVDGEYEYLIRCEECMRKAIMDDERYINAMVQDNNEYGTDCYDPGECEDDEKA